MIRKKEKNTEEKFTYFFEIAPDYQKRMKLNIGNVRSVPNESVTHNDTSVINAKSLMGRYFVEFASNASVNGLKHLVARNRHMFESYGIEDTPKAREFFHFISNATYETMINVPDYDGAPPELWLRILSDLKKEFFYETTFTGEGLWVATDTGICISVGNFVLHYASLQNLLSNNWTVIPLPKHPPDLDDFGAINEDIDSSNYLPSYTFDRDHGKTELVKADTAITVIV
ncbi:hypothetical protein M0802_003813 [Mischocyttarus mexicanus]|nr:hypothetical protein M0802_003813 [Mischocyttarus mexicanus]